MNKINTISFQRMTDMLRDFAGGTVAKYTDEGILRNIFVTNFMEAFTTVNIESDEVIKSINTIMDYIIDLEIPIIDIYEYFGNHKIMLSDLQYFFNNYFSFTNKRTAQLNKIYLMLTGEKSDATSEAVGDLLSNLYLTSAPKKDVYILPKIGYAYKKNKNFFISHVDVCKNFYNNTSLKTYIKNQLNIPNILNSELFNFIKRLSTSYDDYTFSLLKMNSILPEFNLLIFIENLYIPDLTGLTTFTKKQIKKMFQQNAYLTDTDSLLRGLCKKLFKLYINDINKFENKDKQFKLEEYAKKIKISDTFLKTGTSETLLEQLFYSFILNDVIAFNDIYKYSKEVLLIKNNLNNIRNFILKDNRFIRGM